MPRSDIVALSFAKPGYESFTMRVEPKASAGGAAGFVGNAIIGGAAGAVVDIASGAGLDHCPNPVVVNLRRVGSRDPMPTPRADCRGVAARDPNGPVAEVAAN
ncbi:hypothetical protein [Rhodoplanes sp. Z2-YC6860]|uniref:hypothetical protein n=1 Tax=Rhodoplanes sp. Z2-YC6860 TaxID=674703 RepID=UPI00082BD332|nr:hypothetical protein [Rhodoplanes sp. Z2-YC6860]